MGVVNADGRDPSLSSKEAAHDAGLPCPGTSPTTDGG
jgi:hypothetical protein